MWGPFTATPYTCAGKRDPVGSLVGGGTNAPTAMATEPGQPWVMTRGIASGGGGDVDEVDPEPIHDRAELGESVQTCLGRVEVVVIGPVAVQLLQVGQGIHCDRSSTVLAVEMIADCDPDRCFNHGLELRSERADKIRYDFDPGLTPLLLTAPTAVPGSHREAVRWDRRGLADDPLR